MGERGLSGSEEEERGRSWLLGRVEKKDKKRKEVEKKKEEEEEGERKKKEKENKKKKGGKRKIKKEKNWDLGPRFGIRVWVWKDFGLGLLRD